MLNFQEIGELLSLIDSSSCDEVVLETNGIKLIVRRQSTEGAAPGISQSNVVATAAPTNSDALVGKLAESTSFDTPPHAAATSTAAAGFIGSPMVGTFYRSPAPEDPPFVALGAKVSVGDPLCVIEVMKLFTTIYSEIAGTVREIGVEDAQFVEFGQMIFLIEPD